MPPFLQEGECVFEPYYGYVLIKSNVEAGLEISRYVATAIAKVSCYATKAYIALKIFVDIEKQT